MSSDKSYRDKVECICPKCNETHYLNIFWTGKLPARKFHDACLKKCNSVDPVEATQTERRSGQSPYYLDSCK